MPLLQRSKAFTGSRNEVFRVEGSIFYLREHAARSRLNHIVRLNGQFAVHGVFSYVSAMLRAALIVVSVIFWAWLAWWLVTGMGWVGAVLWAATIAGAWCLGLPGKIRSR